LTQAALGDRWRLIAPDLPVFGYSATPDPERFSYTFAGYGAFLGRFVEALQLDRYALYLHDYGSQHGLRLAMSAPARVAALIIQNGDIYEDELGPKYDWLKTYWADPTPEGREQMARNVSEQGFRDEFVGELPARLVERVSPDLDAPLDPHATASPARDRRRHLRGSGHHPRRLPTDAGLPARAPAAHADRLGAARRLHARGLRARLPARPT
jgi:pimeloyl-ACP methyl ester carboxylesterase